MCIRDRAQGVREDHVVVGEAVHDHQRPVRFSGGRQSVGRHEGTPRVRLRVLLRVAEIALRVMRVVEPPVRHRRPGDPRAEDVGAAQHRETRQPAAEGPAADRHPGQVQRIPLREVLQRLHLVVQRQREVVVDGLLPGGGTSGGTPPVRDHDREPLVGEPLRGEVRVVGREHPLSVRPAVRVHEDRQRGVTVVVPRHNHGARDTACAPFGECHAGRHTGIFRV